MRIIHIGGAKTASTSLQLGIFQNLKDVISFGEFGDGFTSKENELIIREFLEVDSAFTSDERFKRLVSQFSKSNNHKMIFSSADIFVARQPTMIAEKLAEIFGSDAKIILVVRNQIDCLKSFYSGHAAWLKQVPKSYFRRHVSFKSWIEFQFLQENLKSDLKIFDYYSQIKPFINNFGEKNIIVLCYEDLINSNPKSWKILSELLGVEVQTLKSLFFNVNARKRITNSKLKFVRVINFLLTLSKQSNLLDINNFSKLDYILNRGSRYEPKLNDDILGKINEYYGLSNSILSKTFNLDLAKHKYPNQKHDIFGE